MKSKIIIFFIIFFPVIILALTIRGIPGNPTEKDINEAKWKDEGPFELSPERGRFALTLSLVENKSFHFSVPIARFAIPDLGYSNGNYVSLFAPGVSLVIASGYLLGKIWGLAQIGAFAIISFFAILNGLLIRTIAIKLKASPLAATLGAFIFLFATPAFTYSVTLYQHHISTFLILLGVYATLRWNNLWSLVLIWFLSAAAIPIDYPNLFLMIPVVIYSLGKMFYVKRSGNFTTISVKVLGFFTFISAIIPLSFFLWFNQASYNNPLQLSGTVRSVKAINEEGKPLTPEELAKIPGGGFQLEDFTGKKSASGFFKTRSLLNGFYTHFVSPDRGIIWFTPIILFGIIGAIYLYRQNQKALTLLLGIIGANVLLYSMWGDPWGGWAFGSRYLVPTYAIMAILISFTLTCIKRNLIFLSFFALVMSYSLFVNTIGAITTSANPPQVEVLNLEKLSGHEEKYTYQRNIDYLLNNRSKSFVWQTWGKNFLSATQYFEILYAILIIVSWLMVVNLWSKKTRSEKNV